MIAYDLDGTFFHPPPEEDASDPSFWSDPMALTEGVEPIRPACELVAALHRAGHTPRVGYLTGRPDVVREVTEQQMADAGLPGGPLGMAPRWNGWGGYLRAKVRGLEKMGAQLYVGDLEHDREAAEAVGVRFLHADVFHRLAGVI